MRALIVSLVFLVGCASTPPGPLERNQQALEAPISLPDIPAAEMVSEPGGATFYIYTRDQADQLGDVLDAAVTLEQQCIDIHGTALALDREAQALAQAEHHARLEAHSIEQARRNEVWSLRLGLAGTVLLWLGEVL